MGKSFTKPVLAVDGGGTRCRVAYRAGSSTVSVETGAANVSTDFNGAVVQILSGLKELSSRLSESPETLTQAPAFVGLAGVTGPVIADRLKDALPFETIVVRDDRPAALRGALGVNDGVVAHCGTGSFLAAQFNGAMRFAGGWGPVLGDEASAQWIGRRALAMTLQTVDGWLEPAPLSKRLLSDFGEPAGIVRFAGSALPSELGALAPLVTEYAEAKDQLAIRVMRDGADELARAIPAIGWQSGQRICLTGGIGPLFAAYLPDLMQVDLGPPEAEPLEGALSLAQELAEEVADERR